MECRIPALVAASMALSGCPWLYAECGPEPGRLTNVSVASIAGQLWNPSNWIEPRTPVAGATVKLLRWHSDDVVSVTTDAKGYFNFGTPTADDYNLCWTRDDLQQGCVTVHVDRGAPIRVLALRVTYRWDQASCFYSCAVTMPKVMPLARAPKCLFRE